MRRIPVVLLLLPLTSGCAEGGNPLALDPLALLAAGVEHTVEVESSVADGRGFFTLTSTLRNLGSRPVTLRVRSCYLHPEDVRGQVLGLRFHASLMLCLSAAHDLTLAPGDSESLSLSGEAPPASVRQLRVRHALEPEHWEPVTLAVPAP